MKAIAAVLSALAVFAFVWLLVALLVAGMAWAATDAGVKPGLFLILNMLLVWILSPAVGAGVAIYATTNHFTSVDPKTVFVSFVSICSALLALALLLEILVYFSGVGSGWKLLLFAAQVAAIMAGAKLGSVVGRQAKDAT